MKKSRFTALIEASCHSHTACPPRPRYWGEQVESYRKGGDRHTIARTRCAIVGRRRPESAKGPICYRQIAGRTTFIVYRSEKSPTRGMNRILSTREPVGRFSYSWRRIVMGSIRAAWRAGK